MRNAEAIHGVARRALAASGWALAGYSILVAIAAGTAAVRLVQSTDMPGLAAIELVLLALPWSVALGIAWTGALGWGGMAGIVLGGVVLNALLLRLAARTAESAWARRRRAPSGPPRARTR